MSLLYINFRNYRSGLLAYLLCRTIETGDIRMTLNGFYKSVLYRGADAACQNPLGAFMARGIPA